MSGCYPHLLLNCLKIHHSRDALPNPGLVVSAWWLILPYRNTPFDQAGRTLGQSTWNGGRGCSARRGEQVSIPHDSDDSICVPRWQRKFGRSFAQLKQIPQETQNLQLNGRRWQDRNWCKLFQVSNYNTQRVNNIHTAMVISQLYLISKPEGSGQDSIGCVHYQTLVNFNKAR